MGKTEQAENENKVNATPEHIFNVRVFSNDANLFMARLRIFKLKVVVDKLQHAVNSRDGLGINLVSALSFNHAHHLFHHVHI